MPSQTFIVRAHARTIHTKPVTFVCAKCQQMATRECYPGNPPKYCLACAPKKKKADTSFLEKGMFHATHYLIASAGKKTEVCLEKSKEPGWYWVRTALDWFSGESIIQYHEKLGLQSQGVTLAGYSLEALISCSVAASAPTSAQPHGVKELCKRFKCGEKLLRKMRSSSDFAQWSQERDPQGLTWEYRDGKFSPVDSTA